jgi:glyoxylase-like metal-dependent hydrolase (beta-lactamase superfamily II)
MKPSEIVPGLFRLALGSVNAYLFIGDDGLTLVDTGYPGSAETIGQQLRRLGYRLGDIANIVVTHCHADHAGSLAELQAQSGAATWMHPADAALVRKGIAVRAATGPTPGLVNQIIYRTSIQRTARTIAPAQVEHEVDDGAELPLAGGLRVIHTPGHSEGQIALLWPAHGGVLVLADAAINIVGLALFPAYENLAVARQSLARLAALDFAVACFGHGRPLARNAAGRFRARWAQPLRTSTSQ